MAYLITPGDAAFTGSGLKKIKESLNRHDVPEIVDVKAVSVHYTHLSKADDSIEQKLTELLPVPPADYANDELARSLLSAVGGNEALVPSSKIYYITPRNTSPWSSKATSIAHVCGLKDQVNRTEKGRAVLVKFADNYDSEEIPFKDVLYDRMTETLSTTKPNMEEMFVEGAPFPLEVIDIFAKDSTPIEVLMDYNRKCGLALDQLEMEYLIQAYTNTIKRAPYDIELFMFAQVNSEHCRHKQFNANWTIDGMAMGKSLFGMIRNTYDKNSKEYIVSAYSDNAAVLEGVNATFWAPDYSTSKWTATKEKVHYLIKVETHNHPTAISPFPGAATGSGGEIRDEGAVGRGSTPKAGLCGFWVSDLLIPDHKQPWEIDLGKPMHYASSLDIMLEAPIGSARFNNEFGRPCLTGCFRTLLAEVKVDDKETESRGYHKPIMIAGGVGTVRPQHAIKDPRVVREGAHVIVLGGPAMLIGLGGGAASSSASGEASMELDFASVQRGNPEMERRAQMVINACVALGDSNPIAMIHDVGAGGLSNALPELVKDAGFGGQFELRQVESADSSMSPLQIWCCEAQERYVLLVNDDGLNRFTSIASMSHNITMVKKDTD
jgi:phosphoribosylformylglycinamidine synthase